VNVLAFRIAQGRGIKIPDKVKRPADVDLEGVPPCIRIFGVQLFNDMNNKSLGKLKTKMGWKGQSECGPYSA
jgi:hypothetical protein